MSKTSHYIIKILTAILLLLVINNSVLMAQPNNTDVRINKKFPQVYITFERIEKRKSLNEEGFSGNYVILRFHNNSIWAINLPVWEFIKENDLATKRIDNPYALKVVRNGIEISPLYNSDDIITGTNRFGRSQGFAIWNNIWIAKQDTVIFAVPQEYLTNRYVVSIPFNYEWEVLGRVEKENDAPRDVEHLVRFYPRQIPSEIRDKINGK